MRNRWGVLALLFFVRGTMAVQFQSVAAVALFWAPSSVPALQISEF